MLIIYYWFYVLRCPGDYPACSNKNIIEQQLLSITNVIALLCIHTSKSYDLIWYDTLCPLPGAAGGEHSQVPEESWGEAPENITKHHKTLWNHEGIRVFRDIIWYHDISWNIMRHHDTYFNILCFFWLFRDVTTINLHLETGGYAWKVRVRYIMICLETSWDIMNLISIFPVFFDSSGMSLQSTYIWRWETGEKWGSDISWYIMTYLKTSWDISLYKVISDIIRCSSSNMFWILLI